MEMTVNIELVVFFRTWKLDRGHVPSERQAWLWCRTSERV